MLSRNVMSTALTVLSFASCAMAQASDRSGLGDFTRSAYPAIACVAGFFIIAYALYYSHVKAGAAGWRNHALWFIFDLLLALWGFFLIFGPDNLASTSSNNFNSPRAAIIGLQLIIQAAIGVFAVYAANAYASLAFAMLGMFNLLCLIGSNLLFNYNQPIWTLDQFQCNTYFASFDLQRCRDDGYLQFLRVIGMFAIFTEGYLILVSLLAYATAVPAYAAHPHHAAAGVPTSTYGAQPAASTYSTAYGQPSAAGAYKTEGQATHPTGTTTTTVV